MKIGGIIRALALGGLILALPACEGVRNQLGLNKSAPDEFRVVSRAPLTLPPDFSLRPPEPGAPRPQTGTASDQAKRAVFRVDDRQGGTAAASTASSGRSLGESSLLKAAGADEVESDIRQIVDRETDRVNEESDDFINRLVFWRDSDPYGKVVDPGEEAQRLRENAALGKDATEGETPTIERKKKALFEDLF
jgi:hypothetical protein